MILKSQRRIAAQLLKVGSNRIWFDSERLEEIKESITKADIRSLIQDGAIQKKPETGISRGRKRKRLLQKRKGRQQGSGSRKGKRTARLPRKRAWILKIRAQRKLLGRLRQKKVITPKTYSLLYRKAKGGFFRSTRHIHLYAQEHKLEHE
ncbi:50S ribosomal protein L19e, partial [Candidatus Woesearchaeota archaeon]|nr:50S ribosomal protein L19e [Candidatus Woesearchaeota archaeon]